jgi:hypothetical protein
LFIIVFNVEPAGADSARSQELLFDALLIV